MDSNLASIRPYPSPFPCPSAATPGLALPLIRNSTIAHDQALLSSAYHDDNRKPRSNQGTTRVLTTTSQNARFQTATLPSASPTSLPSFSAASEWNNSKKQKLTHDSLQVSSSTRTFIPDSTRDTLASSALSLLSLGPYPSYSPSNTESTFFHSFTSNKENLSPQSISSSPSSSPALSPLNSSRSETPLSSSSEVPLTPSPMSSPSPPPSPTVMKNRVEIRHKGKQLKSRCTCCHVCRTSLKNYPRNHLDCTACNAVVCQPCIEFRLSGPTWEVASKEPNWLCPSCLGTCVCQRCTLRPLEIVTKSSLSQKRKSENNKTKVRHATSDAEARQIRLEELLEYHRERDKFIHEIQNVLAIVKRDQREIEYQIAALQSQGEGEMEEDDEQ